MKGFRMKICVCFLLLLVMLPESHSADDDCGGVSVSRFSVGHSYENVFLYRLLVHCLEQLPEGVSVYVNLDGQDLRRLRMSDKVISLCDQQGDLKGKYCILIRSLDAPVNDISYRFFVTRGRYSYYSHDSILLVPADSREPIVEKEVDL